MRTINEEYREVSVEDVTPHPQNPRIGDLDAIQESVESHGFYGAIVVQKSTGRILAGNHRWQAARAAGAETVPAIFVDVDDTEAERILLADNRLGDRGGYREGQLARLLQRVQAEGGGLTGTGYDDQDVRDILARAAGEDSAGADGSAGGSAPRERKPYTDIEEAERLRESWGTDVGQFWTIEGQAGEHRMMIADALYPDNQGRLLAEGEVSLVVTDPPYALFGGSQGTASDMTDDRMVRPFFESTFQLLHDALEEFGHVYVFCDWRSWASIWDTSRRRQIVAKNMVVWNKRGGMGASFMNWHELVFFGHKLPPETVMSKRKAGVRKIPVGNVIDDVAKVVGAERMHNAAKPVELLERFIRWSSDDGDRVLDPYLGSGSTMVAAERTGRVCSGFELEPRHAAVTLQRMTDLGLEPVLSE